MHHAEPLKSFLWPTQRLIVRFLFFEILFDNFIKGTYWWIELTKTFVKFFLFAWILFHEILNDNVFKDVVQKGIMSLSPLHDAFHFLRTERFFLRSTNFALSFWWVRKWIVCYFMESWLSYWIFSLAWFPSYPHGLTF